MLPTDDCFPSAEMAQRAESLNIVHIDSKADFKTHVLDKRGICLVDLFSNRCPPCRILAPIISSLAEKYAGSVTVCKVDVDRAPAVAQRYGVRAIPTVPIIQNGNEIKRFVGLQPETKYAELLDKLFDKDND